MIKCIVNGTEGYPAIQSEIKITRENPYITKGDSFTMEMNFPMDIPENASLFSNLHRMDVSKRNITFSDCSLYADNILIIRGTGRVTEITETTVKLQILGGNSNVKFKSKFQKVFIDRIDTYPAVASRYVPEYIGQPVESKAIFVHEEIQQKGYVGDITQYVFMPVFDTDNGVIANCCSKLEAFSLAEEILIHAAVQPNLMMILRHVIEYLGYTIRNNMFDTAPWNELVIANARQTLNIAHTLPHWSAETFLDEFRKLFNASFIFDDTQMTVDIVRNNEMDPSNDVTYDVEDEYKTNYDEDGIEYMGGSNIKYGLQGGDRSLDDFPAAVRTGFQLLEYASYGNMVSAVSQMSEYDKFTHVFHCNIGYFFYGHEYNEEGEDTGNFTLQQFGIFGPLYRNTDTENFLELRMYPAFMKWDNYNFGQYDIQGVWFRKRDKFGRMRLPNVPNSQGNGAVDYDEKGYVSVSNVLEDGEDIQAEEEEEDTGMPLMWVEGKAVPIDASEHHLHDVPASFTDIRNSYLASKAYSMCFQDPYANIHYIGELHRGGLSEESTVDVNTEQCFRFLTDGLPDPTKIYVFRNKRYLCKKVEVMIKEEGIGRVKTGYFYEIRL